MVKNCRKCGKLTERKVCRDCRITAIVAKFHAGRFDLKPSETREIARFCTINPRKAYVEVPDDLRVMALKTRSGRAEARKYWEW